MKTRPTANLKAVLMRRWITNRTHCGHLKVSRQRKFETCNIAPITTNAGASDLFMVVPLKSHWHPKIFSNSSTRTTKVAKSAVKQVLEDPCLAAVDPRGWVVLAAVVLKVGVDEVVVSLQWPKDRL